MGDTSVNAKTFKSRLKKLLTLKHQINGDKNYSEASSSLFKNFKLSFGNNFNWSKYATSATNKLKNASEDTTSLFSDISSLSESQKNERNLDEVFEVLLSNQEILDGIDANDDLTVEVDEIKNFFANLAGSDGNADDLTMDDFSKFLYDKYGVKNENFLNDEIEKLTAELAALEEAEEAPTSPGSSSPTGPTNPNNTDGDDTAKFDPFPKQRDLKNASGSEIQEFVSDSVNNLKSLSGLKSSDLAKEFGDSGTDLSLMDTISQESRTKLQQAAAEKETANTEMTSAKEALSQSTEEADQEITEKINNVASCTETYSSAQEQYNSTQAVYDSCSQQISDFEASISTVEGSISDLQGQIKPVPQEKRDSKTREVTNRNEIAQVIAANNALKAQIAELEAEKADLEAQKAEVVDEQTKLEPVLEEQKTAVETAQEQLKTAQEELEAAKTKLTEEQGALTELQQTYMDSVTKYQEASEKYNTVKAEVMTEINSENKENAKKADDKLKKEQTDVTKPKITDENYEQYHAMNQLNDVLENKIQPSALEGQAKELWEQYQNNFKTDSDKETIDVLFGSKQAFFATVMAFGDASTGLKDSSDKEITFKDMLLNPDNYKGLSTQIAQLKPDKDGKYNKDEIKKVLEKFAEVEAKASKDDAKDDDFKEHIMFSLGLTAYNNPKDMIEQAILMGQGKEESDKTTKEMLAILYPFVYAKYDDDSAKNGTNTEMVQKAADARKRKKAVKEAEKALNAPESKTDEADKSDKDDKTDKTDETTDDTSSAGDENKDKDKEKEENT